MGLQDDIRGAISDINGVFDDMEVDISYYAWIGEDGYGRSQFASPVTYRAILIQQLKQIFTQSGNQVLTKAYMAFLQPILDTTPNANQQRLQPVDPRDSFVLPDGTTGPTILTGGLVDSGTGRPFLQEVYLEATEGTTSA
jgi:hypothetical protein